MMDREELAAQLVAELENDPTWNEKISILTQVLAGPALPSTPNLLLELFKIRPSQ